MKQFLYVMREDSSKGYNDTPRKKHDNIESAKPEAERLCKETKEPFLILQAIGRVVPEVHTKWESADEQ